MIHGEEPHWLRCVALTWKPAWSPAVHSTVISLKSPKDPKGLGHPLL